MKFPNSVLHTLGLVAQSPILIAVDGFNFRHTIETDPGTHTAS
jgi:hypothetical protein